MNELNSEFLNIFSSIGLFYIDDINFSYSIDNLTWKIKIETKEIILYTIKIRFVNELDMFKPQEISIESYNDYNIIESINNYKL